MHKLLSVLIGMVLLAAIFGCSSTPLSVEPAMDIPSSQSANTHQLWGLWQFTADPARETLDVVTLRVGAMHLNALPFLEPPVLVNLTLESLKFNGNIIEADIGLRHPFLGLNEFTGFDVCGVLITNGSVSGFSDPDIIMAGQGDTRLLNPDGWTRWWNPAEFPHNKTMFAYNDGLLGTPDSAANYNSTLNAYKFFCDDLSDPKAPVSSINKKSRCVFSAGKKNIRYYKIEVGSSGLIFNYAIDANWQFPQGPAPWQVPDDFGANANRMEAWNISVTELGNTLWNNGSGSGGDLSLLIDVWDHYNAGLNTARVESPGNFTPVSSSTPIGGGEGYSTYQLDITGATPAPGSIPLYYIIESEQDGYGGVIPGAPISAYFMGSANVSSASSTITVLIPNGGEKWQVDSNQDITWKYTGSVGPVKIEYSKDNFTSDVHEIVPSTPNTGSYKWKIPSDLSDTVKVKISDAAGPAVYDISDNYFSIVKQECGTGNFGTPIQTPFTDMSISVVKYEVAWLVSGPYAGEMIVSSGLSGSVGTIRRYNMDTVSSHSGSLFITLPSGSAGPYSGLIYHIEVEPVTGRVIVVPDGLGTNNSMLVYNNQGSLLSPTTGISAGSNRKIIAMDANVNGDLWLLTTNFLTSTELGSEVRLERWAYQSGAPYIAHDPAFDLNVDIYFGNLDDKTGKYYYSRNVYDLAILYPEQRMFVFQGSSFGTNNGILSAFDLNASAPPTYRADLYNSSLLSLGCYFAANDAFKVTLGAIWCDHSNSKLDGCRVVVYARTNPASFRTSLARLDRNGKILNEVAYTYNDAYTIGVNEDPDPTKNFLVYTGYSPNACYMSLPPLDW